MGSTGKKKTKKNITMVRYNYHDSLTSTFLAGGAPTSALAALVPLEADEWPLPLAVVAAAESPSSSRKRFWPALAAGLSVTAGTWMTGTPLRGQKWKKGKRRVSYDQPTMENRIPEYGS